MLTKYSSGSIQILSLEILKILSHYSRSKMTIFILFVDFTVYNKIRNKSWCPCISNIICIFDLDLFLYTRNLKNERLKPGFEYEITFRIFVPVL